MAAARIAAGESNPPVGFGVLAGNFGAANGRAARMASLSYRERQAPFANIQRLGRGPRRRAGTVVGAQARRITGTSRRERQSHPRPHNF